MNKGDDMENWKDTKKGSCCLFGDYSGHRILDFDEMNEQLNQLVHFKEQEAIGMTTFQYPIRHFTYGTGPYHVILTAGTHASELITNCFLIHFMKELDQHMFLDSKQFTLHFIPILNPEGTIILTSAIRTVIPRKITPFWEELLCIQYYTNSRLEDNYVIEKEDKDNKLQMWMFRYADSNCIPKKHKQLRESVKEIIETEKLPKGAMIAWSSNGVGIDLNANVPNPRYIKAMRQKIPFYHELRLNQISMTSKGPIGCPFRSNQFQFEPENKAIIRLYKDLIKKEKVLGSFIYHACGNLIYYLDETDEKVNKENSIQNTKYNLQIAKKYQEATGYRILKDHKETTVDYMLKKILPGTILVELGNIRSTPLSQFIDSIDLVYSHIMNDNKKALIETIEMMKKLYENKG